MRALFRGGHPFGCACAPLSTSLWGVCGSVWSCCVVGEPAGCEVLCQIVLGSGCCAQGGCWYDGRYARRCSGVLLSKFFVKRYRV